LKKVEDQFGRKRIRRIIKAGKPRVVCFIGKVAYQRFSGLKDFTFGWQKDSFSSKVFVMHFPLRGKASVRVWELRQIAQAAH